MSARGGERSTGVVQRVDNAAITRYKHKIDAKYPIRSRDLRYPSRASLLGCLCLKFVLVFVVAGFLVMRSLGLDGNPGYADPLALKLIFNDLAYGWCVYGLISLFTYLYLRIKNPAIAIVMFGVLVGITIVAFLVWGAVAPTGGTIVLPILLTIAGVIPFFMDIWGLLHYRAGVPIG